MSNFSKFSINCFFAVNYSDTSSQRILLVNAFRPNLFSLTIFFSTCLFRKLDFRKEFPLGIKLPFSLQISFVKLNSLRFSFTG